MPRFGCRAGRLLGAVLFLIWFCPGRHAATAAVYDPSLDWRTLRTSHFHIHYPSELTAEAQLLAEIAEEVHPPLIEILGWEPAEPTEVTLVDNTDLANGYTTVFPYDQIVIYPVRPSLATSISDYGGWLKMVFVHEYAHVLGLDPVRGYSSLMRKVFGRVGMPATPYGSLFWFLAAPPNVFLPPWFHEGLSTNLETDLTGRGRKDSTFFRMVYRSDVAAGTIPPLDRLGGDMPRWPSYSTRYIYGARMLQMIEEAYGRDALGALTRGHSGRFPYAIDAPAERVTGGDYNDLYQHMVRALQDEYGVEIEMLRTQGITPVRVVTQSGQRNAAPLWLDAGHLIYTHAGPYGPPQLHRHELNTGADVALCSRPGSLTRPTLTRGGEVVYPRVEISDALAGGKAFTDLYRLAAEDSAARSRRVTRGQRILEAAYHPATATFAAVQLVDAHHRLVLLSADGSLQQVLLQEPGVRYDTPRWSPDGTRIAFSRKSDSGHARLALLEVSSGALWLLTPEGAQAGFPTWHPNGRQLAFCWDRSGVFDLYRLDLEDGTLQRLTRLLGGGLEPDWSPDGVALAFSHYSERGFDIAVLDLAVPPAEPPEPAPPPERVDPYPLSSAVSRNAGRETERTSDFPRDEAYRAWPRALPTFWLPDLGADHQGWMPGAWTTGHDPLYRHKYYAAGFYSRPSHRAYGQAIYINDSSYPTVTLRAHKNPLLHAGLFETPSGDLDYWEEDRGVEVEVRANLPRILSSWSFAVGWAWQEVRRLSDTSDDLDGRKDLADQVFQGRLNPLTVSMLYDSSFPYASRFTVGPETGRRVEVLYRLRSESLAAELDRQEVLGTWREYLPLSRREHWVLALRASAAGSWGDEEIQGAFQVGGVDTELPIRGYPARVARGRRAFVGGAEWRMPSWQPYRGIRDLPLFLSKFHVAGFLDSGRVWQGSDAEWRSSIGVELLADTVLGYYLPTTMVVGWAHGFDEDAEDRVYFTVRGAY